MIEDELEILPDGKYQTRGKNGKHAFRGHLTLLGAGNSQMHSKNSFDDESIQWGEKRPSFFYLSFFTCPRIQCLGRGLFLHTSGDRVY
ncbi:hypothetical protein TNCV_4727061 [Trichonephila clavipes]|nr:hypothetical protein TNCV_4727061 [Trichonephila clavipes]